MQYCILVGSFIPDKFVHSARLTDFHFHVGVANNARYSFDGRVLRCSVFVLHHYLPKPKQNISLLDFWAFVYIVRQTWHKFIACKGIPNFISPSTRCIRLLGFARSLSNTVRFPARRCLHASRRHSVPDVRSTPRLRFLRSNFQFSFKVYIRLLKVLVFRSVRDSNNVASAVFRQT